MRTITAADSQLVRASSAWNRFWFAPADPTVLGAIRIVTGLITFYTLFIYSFDLAELIGENAWLDLRVRQEQYRESPVVKTPFDWSPIDLQQLLATGRPIWSVWFHVVDPFWMAVVHGGIVLCSFLFLIGFGTRLTSVLTWFGALSYVHRAPVSVFGVDTMMAVLLLYLMIGPSGAALSVDRLIAKWRAKRRGLPVPALTPSISANLALRLIQVHICIIYGAAGLAKLQGASWWTGVAPWGTLANFEYAPLQYPIYVDFLRFLAERRWLFELTMTIGAVGTLVFEIGYPFMIWRPAWRTAWLWMAVLLHVGIGMFMGLRTFSLIMLAFNLAFVSPETVWKVLRKVSPKSWQPAESAAETPPTEMPLPKPAAILHKERTIKQGAASHVKHKR